MRSGLIIFTLLACLLAANSGGTQNPRPAFRHYTTDHGLPSPETYEILQDRRGYIWISTDNGVSRFNGYEFENFGPEEGLKNNVVFQLYEDYRGRIWMVTMSENLYYYDYEQDSILPYVHNDVIQQYEILNLGGPGFFIDSLDTVYRGLYQVGILRIPLDGKHELIDGPEGGGLVCIEMEDEAMMAYLPRLSSAYFEQRDQLNRFPFHISVDGGRSFNTTWVRYSTFQVGAQYYLRTKDGQILINHNHFLHLFKHDSLIWSKQMEVLPSAAYQLNDGAIFIGINNGGGARRYETLADIPRGRYTEFLPGYTVSHVLEDQAGGLWFATIENGIFYAPNAQLSVYNQEAGLPEDHVTALAFRDADGLFVGFRRGSLGLLDLQKQSWSLLPRHQKDQEIFDIYYDPRRQRLWKGSMWLMYQEGEAWVPLFFNLPGTGYGQVTANKNFKAQGNHLWAGSFAGFGMVDLEKAEPVVDSRAYDLARRMLVAFEAFDGTVWIGTVKGLFQFENGQLVAPSNHHPAFSLRIEDIDQMADSTLVIGTKGGGVILWNQGRETITQISEPEGLTASMIENVHVDASQHILAGTLNGLNRLHLERDTITVNTITMADGLPSNEVTDIASLGEETWVATTRGLVKLPPHHHEPSQPPVVFIEQVKVNNRYLRPGQLGALNTGQNNLAITFLSIDYALNGRILYRYRLGKEEPWNYAHIRTAAYPALPPRDYRFEVQAQNQDGVWSDSQVLRFRIRPPVWLRPWFWVVTLSLFGGLLFGAYRNRVNQLKREATYERMKADYEKERADREKEKARMEKEMQELRQSALQAQINPHFTFNALNSIQKFLADGDRTNATRYLSRFARLIRGTLNASMQHHVTLEDEVNMLEHYLSLEQMRFSNQFSFDIEVDPGLDPFEVEIPPMLIQPYVENAIIHGLLDGRRGGTVQIHYWQDGDYLMTSITDNGIGLTESLRSKKGGENISHSVGMTITEKRLELMDRTDPRRKVKVEELKNEEGEVTGTRVTVRIKTAPASRVKGTYPTTEK